MSTIQMFFLFCWAILDLVSVLGNPAWKFAQATQGKPKHLVKEQMKQQGGAPTEITLYLLALLTTLVVEPGYMLWALFAHVGSPLLAGVAGGILAANLLSSALHSLRGKRQETYPMFTLWRRIAFWFFTLPTLYLCYLLLVAVGMVH
jgi:hypothetical protein